MKGLKFSLLFLLLFISIIGCNRSHTVHTKIKNSTAHQERSFWDKGEAERLVRFNPCRCIVDIRERTQYALEVQVMTRNLHDVSSLHPPQKSHPNDLYWERVALDQPLSAEAEQVLNIWSKDPQKKMTLSIDLMDAQPLKVGAHLLRRIQVLRGGDLKEATENKSSEKEQLINTKKLERDSTKKLNLD